jgi:hypothetical protein
MALQFGGKSAIIRGVLTAHALGSPSSGQLVQLKP